MCPEPLTQAGYTALIGQLKLWVNELRCAVESGYPDGAIYDDQLWPAGSGWDGPSGTVRKRIDEVVEAFSVLQERTGLPPGELSMRQQRKQDQEDSRRVWPLTAGNIKGEMLDVLARMAHDEKAKPRDRRAAILAILDHLHQEASEALLETIRETYHRLEPRLAALERKRTG